MVELKAWIHHLPSPHLPLLDFVGKRRGIWSGTLVVVLTTEESKRKSCLVGLMVEMVTFTL